MTDETYNGWKNYATWAVNLWLSNDEGLYNMTRDLVRETISGESTSKFWTVEESNRYNVADAIKNWVTDELAPDLGASFAADLLGYALGCVDWGELADAWIEDVLYATNSTNSIEKPDTGSLASRRSLNPLCSHCGIRLSQHEEITLWCEEAETWKCRCGFVASECIRCEPPREAQGA